MERNGQKQTETIKVSQVQPHLAKFSKTEEDSCVYRHVTLREGEGLAGENICTCKTCTNNFSDKNEMMIHRKIEHLTEVADCKDIERN